MRCEKSEADLFLYSNCKEAGFVFLIVYVDDMVRVGNSQSAVDRIISNFKERFEIVVSQKIGKFLGITVEDRCSNLKLHNEPMVNLAFEFSKMEECKSAMTLLPAGLN